MNLINAVKSGKKFRRKGRENGHTAWLDANDFAGMTSLGLYKDDILAEDWEIESTERKKIKYIGWLHPNGEIILREHSEMVGVHFKRLPQLDCELE